MFEEGLIVMCTGMGVVFGFLVILVVAMFILGAVIKKLNEWFPVETVVAPVKKVAVAIGEDIAVAIAVAMSRK